MPFTYPADQKRLWNLFSVQSRDELLQNRRSQLYQLMTDLESFDTKNSTTLVDDVLAKMDNLDEIDLKIINWLSSPNPRTVKAESSYLEGSVEYGGQGPLSIWQLQRDSFLQQLKGLIDPCGCFEVQWGCAEVIAT
jgi:hypothetical protein